jgi:hypothetical protein
MPDWPSAAIPRTAPIGLSLIRKTGVDAGPELSVAALGKRAQMPYVWLPRRDPTHEPQHDASRGTNRRHGGLVAVPNLRHLG